LRPFHGVVSTTICYNKNWEERMGKGLILWLLGVPGIVVIALLIFHVI